MEMYLNLMPRSWIRNCLHSAFLARLDLLMWDSISPQPSSLFLLIYLPISLKLLQIQTLKKFINCGDLVPPFNMSITVLSRRVAGPYRCSGCLEHIAAPPWPNWNGKDCLRRSCKSNDRAIKYQSQRVRSCFA